MCAYVSAYTIYLNISVYNCEFFCRLLNAQDLLGPVYRPFNDL